MSNVNQAAVWFITAFALACTPGVAGVVEEDWLRQEQVRGCPVFAKLGNATNEVEESILPTIAEHLARGRMLIEAAGRPIPDAMATDAEMLAELTKVYDAFRDSGSQDRAALRQLYLNVRWTVRRLVFASPCWNFDKLLFVKRLTYTSSHIYTDHYDGSSRYGGNLCLLSPITPDGVVTEIAPPLNGGIFGRFDLSFDGKRLVFSYKCPDKGYRLDEVGVDGGGLRQLTWDAPDEAAMQVRYAHGYDDMDPCYLPNGQIVFTSTRSKRAVICTNNFTSAAMHVIDGDGKNIRCLSGNTINEFAPVVMHDGRILYTRWEYVDKGAGDVQSLWSMHPDGSYPAHVYKNNVPKPPTLIDARQLPGTNHIFVCMGAPHMPLAIGPIILVDIHKGQLNPGAMTNLTPEIALPLHYGYPTPEKGFFKEPYPLSDKLFLVAYNFGPDHGVPAGYGIYVLDVTGHRELVYRAPNISCWQPVPLRARHVPPRVPSLLVDTVRSATVTVPPAAEATLFMSDVYAGMAGIERGRVKYVRVMEDVPKPWEPSWVSPEQGDTLGLQNPAVSLKGHFVIKRVHGVVPVDEDGSAMFTVPAGKNLYLQALDANYMELQRMRTFVNLMPGEIRSCIGCHEPRALAPSARAVTAATHSARALEPQPGESVPRVVHYPLDVQPTFDRHCVECHNATKADGGLDLSGTMTELFSTSYESLIEKTLINHIDSDPRDNFIPAEPPLTFGSHRSKLIEILLAGHYECQLDQALSGRPP